MFLSREEVREIDRHAIEEFGVPGVVLMENAGRGAAEVLLAQGVRGPVTICCGKGNNGGDGFVIARHLANHGVPLHIFLFANPADLTGDAAINYQILARAGLPIAVSLTVSREFTNALAVSEWTVDALFGTGLRGSVRAPFDQVIAAINASPAKVLAIDIPSGLDCDTGQPLGPTVRAQHTVTFVAKKIGFAQATAQEWLGRVHVVDIGVPLAIQTNATGRIA